MLIYTADIHFDKFCRAEADYTGQENGSCSLSSTIETIGMAFYKPRPRFAERNVFSCLDNIPATKRSI